MVAVSSGASSPVIAEAYSGLQLPSDRLRNPGTGSRLDSLWFDLPHGRDGLQLLSAAAFVIQLARYSQQPSIPLLVARTAESTGKCWQASLDSELDRQCRALLDQLRHELARHADALPQGHETPAALLLVDSGSLASGDAARAAFESSPLSDPGVELCLVVAAGSPDPAAAFVYNAELFDAATVERFASHFRTLLGELRIDSDDTLGSLSLLTQEEADALRAVASGRTLPYPPVPIHQLIELHATTTPAATAVRFREQTLSYAQLNAAANQLARYLIQEGVTAESRVMACVEPGLEIAIVLLAILKSGGVYVPLEPTYPDARIRVILEDTQPKLIVTSAKLAAKLPLDGFSLLRLDADAAVLSAFAQTNPDVAMSLEQTAYIFYTSGTTGKPKGVMASHANLIYYITSAQQRYEFSSREVMPAIARFSFSISLFELLSPLVAGGTLLVLEREHVLDPARMTRTFTEITFFHCGPSLLRGLLAYIRQHCDDFSVFAKVRHASSGGDMVSPELLEQLKQIFPRAEVFVIYGCSEVSCMGCQYPAPRDRVITRSYVGSPFDNVTVRILDAQRRPVPFGIVGEICFAGSGVVKGYLNRPELTAEKFVEIDGQRFYGTGDMGRVNVAGEVEILGRRDFQIQLRGMRIELGEIEYALRKAPGVHDGVVMARTDASGEKVLVAYVVFKPEHAPNFTAIRQYMLQHLPDYMVPAQHVPLAKLPVNHNMKIDRHALPAPEAVEQVARSIRPAETATERELVRLWKELLHVEEVGLDDNFFELGGHSLLVMQLSLAVERCFGAALEGMEVLREPLVVLAGLLDQRLGRPAKAASPQPQAAAPLESFECFHFGRDRSLYGVVHGTASASPRQALLICGPVGQEQVRCDFILRKLSRQLASHGVVVMRFDYFGCGNSLGDNIEGDCERWREDVAEAFQELQRRVPTAKIAVLGVRLGAALAWSAREQLAGAKLIVWEAVENGSAHLEELQRMHGASLRELQSVRFGRKPRPIPGGRELMGFTWSHATINQLRQLRITPEAAAAHRVARVALSGRDCRWTDIALINDVLPDLGLHRPMIELLEARQ